MGMYELKASAHVNIAPSTPLHTRARSPEDTSTSILQQAITGMVRDSSPSIRPEHEFISRKLAVTNAFTPSLSAGTSQDDWLVVDRQPGEEQLGTSSNTLVVPGLSQQDLDLFCSDEDAEGELDDSFQSQHSFWAPAVGDMSGSTVCTLDVDESPVPLLGRDGRWKGKAPVKEFENNDHMEEHQFDHGRARPASTSRCPDGATEPLETYASPYQGTRHRSAASNMSINLGSSSRSSKDKRTRTDEDIIGAESPIKAKKKPMRKSQESRMQPKLSNEFASSTALSSGDGRQGANASSEIGSISSPKLVSSPGSSTGRYKLKNKASVPVLSLAALMSPSSSREYQSPDEAAYPSRDWLVDNIGQSPLAQAHANDDAVAPTEVTAQIRADEGKGDIRDVLVQLAREPVEEAKVEEHNDIAKPENEPEFEDVEWNSDSQVQKETKREDLVSAATVRDRGRRQFPSSWEIHPDFPLLYTRYSVPSSVSPEVLEMLLRHLNPADVDDTFHEIVTRAQTSHGAFNKPRSILDLYTPRFVKGVSANKVGMCPVCYEDGRVHFFKTKFSAYNYHLQNFHGICALTGLPFTPPTKFRLRTRNAKPRERTELIQGFCHSCKIYIDMQGPKETDVKVAEIYWWKHAQACHRKSRTPAGVGGFFVEDKWFERICMVLELVDGLEGEIEKLLAGSK